MSKWLLDTAKNHRANGLAIYKEMLSVPDLKEDAYNLLQSIYGVEGRFDKYLRDRGKKYHYVYQTKNLVNGKTYIGVHSTNNLNDEYIGSGSALRKAIKKYGKENFSCVIMAHFDTMAEAYEEERYLVNKDWISKEENYNISIGGMGAMHNPQVVERFDREEWIKLHDQGMSKSAIARKYNVTESLIRHFFRKRGVKGRSVGVYKKLNFLDRDDLIASYKELGSYKLVADKYDVSVTAVYTCIGEKFLNRVRKIRETNAQVRKETKRRKAEYQKVIEIYHKYLKEYKSEEIISKHLSGKTYAELSKEYGVHRNFFIDILDGKAIMPHVKAKQWREKNKRK